MYFVSPGNTLCCELVIAVMSICLAIISKVTFSSMFKEESTWPCVNVPICRQVSSLALLKMNHNCWAKSTLLFSIFLANGTKRKIRSIVKISGGFWRAILMRLRYKRTHTDFNHKEPASFFLWTGENSQISLGKSRGWCSFWIILYCSCQTKEKPNFVSSHKIFCGWLHFLTENFKFSIFNAIFPSFFINCINIEEMDAYTYFFLSEKRPKLF